ncbi:class E sortase [Wenjunlia tyrosinilytica]|uniref:class E sortase n=1 Tax=Wenjunlia tyrosinilytica TaxID=1544741 RepID=UPI0016644EC5|nr:class E sortase [Wenjunlia tyrosinilytica]
MSLRLVLRTLSELCVTAGTLIILFVVHLLFWTGVRADRAMDGEVDRLQHSWSQSQRAHPRPSSTAGSPRPGRDAPAPPASGTYREGKAFAVMYIPRLGHGWHKPVLEGTSTGVLRRGLGHYTGTARLGATGNFSVAGHRRTYGDPFKDFPRLRPGDPVVLTDGASWYTYRIDTRPYRTLPSDVGVIDPVPARSGFTGPGRYLTLTTCDPEWGHSHRLIVWAHLDARHPVGEGKPEALNG